MTHPRILRAIQIATLRLAAKPGMTRRRRQRLVERELGRALLDAGTEAIVRSVIQGP